MDTAGLAGVPGQSGASPADAVREPPTRSTTGNACFGLDAGPRERPGLVGRAPSGRMDRGVSGCAR